MRGVVGIGTLGAALLACSGPASSFAPLLPGPRVHASVASAAPKPTAKPKAPETPLAWTVDLPVGASSASPAAEHTTEIVRDLAARFDLWPGLGLHTVYPAQFGKVLAADDAARAAFDARWSKMLLDAPDEAPLYGALVEAHQALVLDAQHVALGQAPGATISVDVKTWNGMHEAAMLAAYLRAWAGRASLPTRLATLVRARLGHWEEVLGAPRIVAVAATLGVVPPKHGFALGGAGMGAPGVLPPATPPDATRELMVQALLDKVVPSVVDLSQYDSLDSNFLLGVAALSRDGKWRLPAQPLQPNMQATHQAIEAKAFGVLADGKSSTESKLVALRLLDKAASIASTTTKSGDSTSVAAVVIGYTLVFRARKSLHPTHAALPEYARVRLAVLEDTLGLPEMGRIGAGAKLSYQPGMWALPGVLP